VLIFAAIWQRTGPHGPLDQLLASSLYGATGSSSVSW